MILTHDDETGERLRAPFKYEKKVMGDGEACLLERRCLEIKGGKVCLNEQVSPFKFMGPHWRMLEQHSCMDLL